VKALTINNKVSASPNEHGFALRVAPKSMSDDQPRSPPGENDVAGAWVDAIIDRLQSKDLACRCQGAAELAELLTVTLQPVPT
jgi:hypothetical protein